MCGIVGLFDSRSRQAYSRDLITRLNNVQFHRGPDSGRVHLEPGIALGHRRLAIIDVASGAQPLTNEDESVWIVFNGEIYNYKELVPELRARGHVFRTRCDTEVIVHAWEEWGAECVRRLRGMFAFAIWDRNRQTLFLARDRLGVKPLHYTVLADGSVLFASELKGLMAHPAVARKIDPNAVEEYFSLGYVAEPRSIFSAVSKLPAAHVLEWRHGAAMPLPRPYWDVQFTLDNSSDPRAAGEELRARVTEAVRIRMEADVPLGAFLSGGVDSSVVVASMAGLSTKPVQTCAIGFEDARANESPFAQLVATRYNTAHSLDIVDSENFDLIDTLAGIYDEPFADSSALPTLRVCQLARQHVTVALSGDGGDETFGGYRRYRLHAHEEQVRRLLPAGLRQLVFGVMGHLYPKMDWAPRPFRAKTTLQALALSAADAYAGSVSLLRTEDRARLFSRSLRTELDGYNVVEVFRKHARTAGTEDALAMVQYLDYKTWLVGDINTKVDRASMFHSLEVREPLMDHQLIEWMATLPSSFKIRHGVGKWLLKQAFEAQLPHKILYRQKMGFSVPLATWLRGPLAGRMRSLVTGERLLGTGLFDPAVVQSMVSAHIAGRRDWSSALWSLMMFDGFLRNQESPESKINMSVT